MKKLLIFLLLLPLLSAAQAPSLPWVQFGAGTSSCRAPLADGAGNIYLGGAITSNNATFTIGNKTLIGRSAYLCKVGPDGTPIWAVQSGTASASAGVQGIDKNANIYMFGYSNDSISFGSLPPTPALGYFIVKYDSSGHPLWCNWITENNGNIHMSCDEDGNVYVCGSYSYTMYFGSAADSLPFQTTNRAYLVKYNSAGSLIWSRVYNNDLLTGVVCSHNSVYVVGEYDSSTTFDGLPINKISAQGITDRFVARLDTAGHALWIQPFNNQTLISPVLAAGKDGGCYLGGSIGISAFFGNSMPSITTYSLFIAHYSQDSAFSWVQALGGTGETSSFNADTAGNLYLCAKSSYGYGAGMLGNCPIPAVDSNNHQLTEVVKTDSAGTIQWATYGTFKATNTNLLRLNGGCSDNFGNVYISGTTDQSIQFGTQTIAAPANSVYLAKLASPTKIGGNNRLPAAVIYPNPAASTATVSFGANTADKLQLTDATGKLVLEKAIKKGQKEVTVSVANYPAGVYFIQLSGPQGISSAKLTVAH